MEDELKLNPTKSKGVKSRDPLDYPVLSHKGESVTDVALPSLDSMPWCTVASGPSPAPRRFVRCADLSA